MQVTKVVEVQVEFYLQETKDQAYLQHMEYLAKPELTPFNDGTWVQSPGPTSGWFLMQSGFKSNLTTVIKMKTVSLAV